MGIGIFDHVYKASSAALNILESRIKSLASEISAQAGQEDQLHTQYEAAKAAGETKVHRSRNNSDQTVTVTEYNVLDDTGKADYFSTPSDLSAQQWKDANGLVSDPGDSTSVKMLELQKTVAEWTIILGVATSLLKSLSDGLEGVARNI